MSRNTRTVYYGSGHSSKPPGKALSVTSTTFSNHGQAIPIVHSHPSAVSQPYKASGPNRKTTEQHSASAKPAAEYKWDSSIKTLAKEIPEFDKWMKTRLLFKDAIFAVNDKLLGLKEYAAEQHPDYKQSKEWKAKEEKYLKEVLQLTEQVQLLQRQLQTSHGDKGRGGSSKYEKEIERLRQENEDIKSQLQSAKIEKEQLLHRLSKLAGAKLSDNNPEITDLSDPNRPQKLALMYNELYNNVWTEAFESMPKENDKGKIRVLLNMFVEIWKFCENLGKHQLTAMENLMLQPWQSAHSEHGAAGAGEDQYLTEVMKSIKEARKLAAKETKKRLFKQFLLENPQYGALNKDMSLYAEACMNLCWLCAIQDPPIEFVYTVKEGEAIDSACFKPFERSGKIVEFLVWPAMLLYKGGPVLTNGVVQVVKGKK